MSDSSTGAPQSGGGRPHEAGSFSTACSGTSGDLHVGGSSRRCCAASLSGPSPYKDPSGVVQELLSSLSEDACLAQKGLAVDPVNLKLPSPAGSEAGSPVLDNRINIFNSRKQEERGGRERSCVLLQTKLPIHLQGGSTEPSLEEKHRLLGPPDQPLGHLPDT